MWSRDEAGERGGAVDAQRQRVEGPFPLVLHDFLVSVILWSADSQAGVPEAGEEVGRKHQKSGQWGGWYLLFFKLIWLIFLVNYFLITLLTCLLKFVVVLKVLGTAKRQLLSCPGKNTI